MARVACYPALVLLVAAVARVAGLNELAPGAAPSLRDPTTESNYLEPSNTPEERHAHTEHRPAEAAVPASNCCDPFVRLSKYSALTSAARMSAAVDRLACVRWGPGCGAVRGMTSFHETFH